MSAVGNTTPGRIPRPNETDLDRRVDETCCRQAEPIGTARFAEAWFPSSHDVSSTSSHCPRMAMRTWAKARRGQKDEMVFWYKKPDGGYRAIYGDLTPRTSSRKTCRRSSGEFGMTQTGRRQAARLADARFRVSSQHNGFRLRRRDGLARRPAVKQVGANVGAVGPNDRAQSGINGNLPKECGFSSGPNTPPRPTIRLARSTTPRTPSENVSSMR